MTDRRGFIGRITAGLFGSLFVAKAVKGGIVEPPNKYIIGDTSCHLPDTLLRDAYPWANQIVVVDPNGDIWIVDEDSRAWIMEQPEKYSYTGCVDVKIGS